MQEVEVKYRVAGDEVGPVLSRFISEGVVWTAPVHQDDQAYAEAGWDYGTPKIGVRFARIRTEGAVHLFTVKVPQANELLCREQETVVEDRDQMDAALRLMGYRPTIRISKRRRTGRWGTVGLCLDEVDGLGVLLEAEVMLDDDSDGIVAQVRLDQSIKGLGLALERVTDTYDSLLRQAGSGLGGAAPIAR